MFRKRLYPITMVVLALVIALVSIGITSKPQVAHAQEVCEEYNFYLSREPQLYADGYPHERTATEANGKNMPPGKYKLTVWVTDNHGNQGQKQEQVLVLGKITPDLPEYQDPTVWRLEVYDLGTVTITEPTGSVAAAHAFAGQKIGPQSVSVTHIRLVRCFEEVIEVVKADCTDGYAKLDNPTPYGEEISGVFTVTDERSVTTEYPFSLSMAAGKVGSVTVPWTTKPFGKTTVTATWSRSWTNEKGTYNSGALECGGYGYSTLASVSCEKAEGVAKTNIPGTMKWKFTLNGKVIDSGGKHITKDAQVSYPWGLNEYGPYDLQAEIVFVPDNSYLEAIKDVDEKVGETCGEPPVRERQPACSNVWAWRFNGLPFTNGDQISPWGEPLTVKVKVNQDTQLVRAKELGKDWITDKMKPDKESGIVLFEIEKFRPNRDYGIYVSGFGFPMNLDPDCILYANAWSGGKASTLDMAGQDSLTISGRSVYFGNGNAMDQAYWLSDNVVGLHLNALIGNEVVPMPGALLLNAEVGTRITLNIRGVTKIFRVTSKFSDVPQQGDGSMKLLDLANRYGLVGTTCQPFSWDPNLGRYTLFAGATLTEVHNPHIAQ